MARLSSRTRSAHLDSVFSSLGTSVELNTRLAQISVLYEDLRIESFAVAARSIKRLDILGPKYRRYYFLRRSMLTLLEFSGALGELNRIKRFQVILAGQDKAIQRRWAQAIKFFNGFHAHLKKARNLVGGHFGFDAAKAFMQHVDKDAVSSLEIAFHRSGRGGGPRLYYAGEIAASALVKALPNVKARGQEISDLIKGIADAYEHATGAVHVAVLICLWERFGR